MSSLLSVSNLSVAYPQPGWRTPPRTVVSDVSFSVERGEIVALVGESGSGKSTIGRAVLGLAPIAQGSVHIDGTDVTRRTRAVQQKVTRMLQVVFQDPYSSLNPSKTIGESLTEPLRVREKSGRMASNEVIAGLLEQVGLPADAASRYPSRFSGGQRQRIAIARALSISPSIVVCDEPTSALDVSTQKRVLELLGELRSANDLGYLFITHDLAVVRHFADRVLVLRGGEIVEEGTAEDVCVRPRHPYTRELVAAAPVPNPRLQRVRRAERAAARAADSHGD